MGLTSQMGIRHANLVSRVSPLPVSLAPGDGKMRYPGNEVGN